MAQIQAPDRIAFFLLLDVVPDYVQKTFGMDERGRFEVENEWYQTVREGEEIPRGIDLAVILINEDGFHLMQAAQLSVQIKSLVSGVRVIVLPIRG